jgi:hypothetical protein
MRLIPVLTVAVLLSVPDGLVGAAGSPQASANVSGAQRGSQDWTEFASREDRFTCNFPGIEKILTERSKSCPAGAELDEAGNGIRYQAIYLHGAPPPPVNSRGGQGGFGRINAPGAPAAQDGAAPPQSGQPR